MSIGFWVALKVLILYQKASLWNSNNLIDRMIQYLTAYMCLAISRRNNIFSYLRTVSNSKVLLIKVFNRLFHETHTWIFPHRIMWLCMLHITGCINHRGLRMRILSNSIPACFNDTVSIYIIGHKFPVCIPSCF